jgi:hypothetical protein
VDVDLLDKDGKPGRDGVADSLSVSANFKAVRAVIKR